jgi:hypothetical protein
MNDILTIEEIALKKNQNPPGADNYWEKSLEIWELAWKVSELIGTKKKEKIFKLPLDEQNLKKERENKMRNITLAILMSLIGLTGTLANIEPIGPQQVIVIIPEPYNPNRASYGRDDKPEFIIECPKGVDYDG